MQKALTEQKISLDLSPQYVFGTLTDIWFQELRKVREMVSECEEKYGYRISETEHLTWPCDSGEMETNERFFTWN